MADQGTLITVSEVIEGAREHHEATDKFMELLSQAKRDHAYNKAAGEADHGLMVGVEKRYKAIVLLEAKVELLIAYHEALQDMDSVGMLHGGK